MLAQTENCTPSAFIFNDDVFAIANSIDSFQCPKASPFAKAAYYSHAHRFVYFLSITKICNTKYI